MAQDHFPEIPYGSKSWSLDTQRNDPGAEIWRGKADFILVESITGTAEIKINSTKAASLTLEQGRTYSVRPNPIGPTLWIERIYLINDKQSGGSVKLSIGGDAGFAITPNTSAAVSITSALPAGGNTIGGVNVVNTPAVTVSNTPAVTVSNTPTVTVSGANIPTKLAAARKETLIYNSFGSVAANTTVTIVDTKAPCELESLAISTDNANCGVEVFAYDHTGTLGGNALGLPQGGGTGLSSMVYPGPLQADWSGENDFFKLFVNDTTNSKYAFGMKRQAVFNAGMVLHTRNLDSAAHNISIVASISVWEA